MLTLLLQVLAIGNALAMSNSYPITALPPAETGNVDGRAAVLFWPKASPKHWNGELPSAKTCLVYVQRASDLTSEGAYPCGEWFVPQLGQHRAWIESESWISETPIMFYYGGGESQVGTRVLGPVIPAATIRVLTSGHDFGGKKIRLLSLEETEGFGFDRQAARDEAQRGIRFPAGKVLAAAFNERDEAIAISSPVNVPANHAAEISLSLRNSGSTVLAVFSRPLMAHGPVQGTPKVHLAIGTNTRDADIIFGTRSRVYAVWYGLPPATAKLRLVSADMALEPIALHLDGRSVVTIRQTLTLPLP